MPNAVQEESSSFTSTTKKSVQVFQTSGSFDQAGQGQVTSQSSTTKSSTKSQSVGGQQQDALSTSTSASSIASDSTLGGGGNKQMCLFDDFIFRPTRISDLDTIMNMGLDSFEDVSRQGNQSQDGQTFEQVLDVHNYSPSDINVKVTDNLVTISAKKEEKSENRSEKSSFSKKFTIPSGVKPESLTCTFTKTGQLRISAPIERRQEAIQNKQVTKTQSVDSSSCTSSRKGSLDLMDELVVRPTRRLVDVSEMNMDNLQREISTINDGKKFEQKIEIKNFSPDEVQIRITKTLIKIEGKHESEFASRSFYREMTIPYGVKASTVQCSMSDDGILTISAPIQQSQSQLQQQQQTISTSQQQQQSKSTQQVQQQQQQKVQQQSVTRKDSTESMSSTTSASTTASSRRLEDMILRPEFMNLDSLIQSKGSMFEDVSKQICNVDDGKKFQVKIPVEGFSPENLQVKISNGMVVIEGKQETANSSKQFFKKFTLPQNVNPEKIKSSLSPEGLLTVSAPIEVKQSQIVNQAQEQQQRHVQASDSTSSISSNTSTLSSASTLRDHDFILRPILDSLDSSKDISIFEDISRQLSQSDKNFETAISVPDYKPEELSIKISDNMVTISGSQEKRQENNFSQKQFFKRFTLPMGTKPEEVTSSLSPQGVLTIKAPIQRITLEQQLQQQKHQSNVSSVKKTTVEQSQQVFSSNQQQQEQQRSVQEQQCVQQKQQSLQQNVQQQQQQQHISNLFSDMVTLRPIFDFNLESMDKLANFEDISKVCSLDDSANVFEVKVSVVGYSAEEISIKVSQNVVTIQGKKETKGESNFQSKTFQKKMTIPAGVRPEDITSSLSPEGILTLKAPIDKELQKKQSTTVTKTVISSEQVSVHEGGTTSSLPLSNSIVLRPKRDATSSSIKSEQIGQDLCHVCDGQTFEMKYQLDGYSAEDIEVKIVDGLITIEGKQEKDGAKRSFMKNCSLPKGVRPETLTCTVNENGVLTVSAPIQATEGLGTMQVVGGSEQQQQQSKQTFSSSSVVVSSSSSTATSSTVSTSSNSQQQQQQLQQSSVSK